MDLSLHTFRSPRLQAVVNEAVGFLEKTPLQLLPPPTRFEGTGVYALYYCGGFDLYSNIAAADPNECALPIYVGKAVPEGWRTSRTTSSASGELYRRLNEHGRSIMVAEHLSTTDFRCRFMLLLDAESQLIGAIEAGLIRKHSPIWNCLIDGFGNHDPGSGRYNQAPSEWDVLHPGRSWVSKLTGQPPNVTSIRAKLQP